MFDRGIPSICYGLRGLVYFQIDLRGTKSDLHSGSFGGAVANPAMVLAQILAQMKDRGGRVKIPGFYDDVRELRDEERAEFKKLPFNETRYRKELGAPKLFGESGYTTLERVWGRPTFEVNGLLSGFTGDGAKTVIPAVAMAKVSMRLVPDQDPDAIAALFEAYRPKVTPKTVEVKVTRMHGGKPWMTEFDNPFVQAAGRAIEKGFGKAPVFNREGGSIPVVATFQEILGLPSVLFGVGLPDENAHAPNEKLDLGNFHGGVIASAYLYDEVGGRAVSSSGRLRLGAARRFRGAPSRRSGVPESGLCFPGDSTAGSLPAQITRMDPRRKTSRPPDLLFALGGGCRLDGTRRLLRPREGTPRSRPPRRPTTRAPAGSKSSPTTPTRTGASIRGLIWTAPGRSAPASTATRTASWIAGSTTTRRGSWRRSASRAQTTGSRMRGPFPARRRRAARLPRRRQRAEDCRGRHGRRGRQGHPDLEREPIRWSRQLASRRLA